MFLSLIVFGGIYIFRKSDTVLIKFIYSGLQLLCGGLVSSMVKTNLVFGGLGGRSNIFIHNELHQNNIHCILYMRQIKGNFTLLWVFFRLPVATFGTENFS
jgi:hypothetical protein